MRDRNSNATNKASNVRCLEVLISKRFITNSSNLLWTLSVYSLENHPVKEGRSFNSSEIFHFMVFDWERTIKKLLEKYQVPYSIIKYFSPQTIYSDSCQKGYESSTDEMLLLAAADDLEESAHRRKAADHFQSSDEVEKAGSLI